MNTVMLLMAQYGSALIPADKVATDYFDLTPGNFARKVALGEIRLTMVRMTDSQKSARAIHVADLAAYIDRAREEARKISA